MSHGERDHQRQLGDRLRRLRLQQGLTLGDVEERSRGRWKAVVVGSYERGDRAVTISRLAELARFYGVPLAALLPAGGARSPRSDGPRSVMLDLSRLEHHDRDERGQALARYASTIQRQRGDWAGRVLSLRRSDVAALAVVLQTTAEALVDELAAAGVVREPA